MVDEKNIVSTRPVRLGVLENGLREITEGLKPGEKVVVVGLQNVRPGSPVEPLLVDMPGGVKSEVRSQNSEVGDAKLQANGNGK